MRALCLGLLLIGCGDLEAPDALDLSAQDMDPGLDAAQDAAAGDHLDALLTDGPRAPDVARLDPDAGVADVGAEVPDATEAGAMDASATDAGLPAADLGPHCEIEVCDGLNNDCDELVDEGACDAATFDFCALRRAAGTDDTLCEDFPADALDREPTDPARWRAGGLASAGALVPVLEAGGYISPADPEDHEDGGHVRHIPLSGPAFSVSYTVQLGDAVAGVGLFFTERRDMEGGVARGRGYSFEIRRAPDAVRLEVRAHPSDEALAVVRLGAQLEAGEIHRAEFRRAADGRWAIRWDGTPQALEADAVPDLTWPQLDEVSTLLYAGERRPRLDNLVVRFDEDGDGLYPPEDNCPEVANPDQLDQDGDGRGTACDDTDGDGIDDGADGCLLVQDPAQVDTDGDGIGDRCDFDGQRLVVSLGRAGAPTGWTLDPASGILRRLWRVADPAAADGDTPRGHVGIDDAGERIVFTRGEAVLTRDNAPLDEDGRLEALMYTEPSWLADGRLVYRDLAGQRVCVADDCRALAAEGESVRAFTNAERTEILIARQGPDGTDAERYDPDWMPLGEPEHVPSGIALPPVVQHHPAEPVWLIAGVDGNATGVIEVGQGGRFNTAAPTHWARYTPDGASVVALHGPDELGRYEVALYDRGGERIGTLLRSSRLSPLSLSWTRAPGPALSDGDGDRLDDSTDFCPAVPNWDYDSKRGVAEGGPSSLTQIAASPFEYAVSWIEGDPREASHRIRLLTRDGAPRGPAALTLDARKYKGAGSTPHAPMLAWSGRSFGAIWDPGDLPENAFRPLDRSYQWLGVERIRAGRAATQVLWDGSAFVYLGGLEWLQRREDDGALVESVGSTVANVSLGPQPGRLGHAAALRVGGDLLVAYVGDPEEGFPIYARRVAPDGVEGERLTVAEGVPRGSDRMAASLARVGDHAIVTWNSAGRVEYRRIDLQGRPLGEVRGFTLDGSPDSRPSIAAIGDRAVITWSSPAGGAGGVRVLVLNDRAEVLAGPFRLEPHMDGLNPAVTSDGETMGVVWSRATPGGPLAPWFARGRLDCP